MHLHRGNDGSVLIHQHKGHDEEGLDIGIAAAWDEYATHVHDFLDNPVLAGWVRYGPAHFVDLQDEDDPLSLVARLVCRVRDCDRCGIPVWVRVHHGLRPVRRFEPPEWICLTCAESDS